jgi:predicted GNAT superfamily acetyltransferase
MGEITYALMTDLEQIRQVVQLEKLVWSDDVVTPLPQFVASIHHGGVLIGAIDSGRIVGFCYGFPGYRQGEVYLCSHMMGIHPDYRNQGIGVKLKFYQREWALSQGYKKIVWTYDPLETRNAFLNLCKLGAICRTYIESYYGELNDGLNRGLPSDRFVVEWELNSSRAETAAGGASIVRQKWMEYPNLLRWKLNEAGCLPLHAEVVSEAEGYLIPVPKDIQTLKQTNLEAARRWRMQLRELFQRLYADGYAAVGLLRSDDPVQYYVVEKLSQQPGQ